MNEIKGWKSETTEQIHEETKRFVGKHKHFCATSGAPTLLLPPWDLFIRISEEELRAVLHLTPRDCRCDRDQAPANSIGFNELALNWQKDLS